MFSNDTYDKLKWIAQILLPALATLYFTLCSVWGFPYGEQVVGTIAAVDTFLGILLGISSKHYQGDGDMIIDTSDPEKDIYQMVINGDLEGLQNKDSITFKVRTPEHMRNE